MNQEYQTSNTLLHEYEKDIIDYQCTMLKADNFYEIHDYKNALSNYQEAHLMYPTLYIPLWKQILCYKAIGSKCNAIQLNLQRKYYLKKKREFHIQTKSSSDNVQKYYIMRTMKKNNIILFFTFTIFILTVSLAKCVRIPTIYFAAGDNFQEIEKFLDMGEGETYRKSAMWLALNMSEQYSYENTVSRRYYDFLNSIQDSTTNYKRNWLYFNSTCTITPQLQRDIKVLKADMIYENTQNAINTWKASQWKSNISFNLFCKYILPYKIENEPIVNWRHFYKEKYSHLIKGTKTLKEAFYKVYAYEMETFPVRNTYFPYAQDALLLDKLHCGNCKQRAFHMVYVMRALGIPVAVDYTPVWSNYGNKGHYWVVMVNDDMTVTTHTENKDEYIDGAYEKTTCNYNQCKFTSSIDSLKKIAKIYRLTFWKSQQVNKRDSMIGYKHLTNPYTCEVTNEYKYITKHNIIETQVGNFSKLFVCTYTQGDGWIPVGKAKQVGSTHVDIGSLLHDNIVIISEYANGFLTPVSSPYLIRHDKKPFKIEADLNNKEDVTLYRKYLLRNIWINRWAEIIGTKIETSNDRDFNTKPVTLYQREFNKQVQNYLIFS